MASEQMQALVDINLLEIQLAALDALKPSSPAAQTARRVPIHASHRLAAKAVVERRTGTSCGQTPEH